MMQKFLLILFCCFLFGEAKSQEKLTVSGTVSDETGELLIGATIVEKGTQNASVADLNGSYKITVPTNAELVFSYTGTESQEIEVKGRNNINVALVANARLKEVVIGYTTQKKKDLTGAVSVVEVASVSKTPYANVLQAMAGRVSGVTFTQDGQPGSGRTSVRVRGVTTLNNNSPLYVIDGVQTRQEISNLNSNDIESIQVLKDASAASVYGIGSAGGVIVITTKKGKAGKTSIEGGSVVGSQTLGRKIDLLDATQWGEAFWAATETNQARRGSWADFYGTGPTAVVNPLPYTANPRQVYVFSPKGTNWYDEIYNNGASNKQYYLNVSKATDKGQSYFGASWFDQDGLIKNTGFNRATIRLNTDYKLTDWLKIGQNFTGSRTDQVQTGTQRGQDGIPTDVIRQHPLLPVRDAFGLYAGKVGPFPDVRNMVSVLEKNKGNTADSWRLLGNAYAELNVFSLFKVLPEAHRLRLRTNYGMEYSNFYAKQFDASFQEGDYDIQNNFLTNTFGDGRTSTWTNSLEYNLDTRRHSFKLFGAVESIAYKGRNLSVGRSNFEVETDNFTVISAGTGAPVGFGGGTQTGRFSQIGRAEYGFDDRYLFTATVRRDQSSRVKGVGIFPAASVGWNLTNEKFIRSVLGNSFIKSAKIRASYGVQGNEASVGTDFPQLSTFGPDINHADYDIAGSNTSVYSGYLVQQRGNPNIKWETTKQSNIGLDLGLFGRSVELSADYYIKNTSDILLQKPLLAAQGEGSRPNVNIGAIQTKGFDFSLGYFFDRASSPFKWSAEYQFTTFKTIVQSFGEKIGSLGTEGETYLPIDGNARYATGKPIASFYGYVVEGIFQNVAEVESHASQLFVTPELGVGRIKYKDLNGDNVIDDADRTYLGSPYPKYSMGLNLSGKYKGIGLTAFFYASIGQKVYNELRWYTDFFQSGNFNHGTRILNAWSPTNTGSSIPAATLEDYGNNEQRASSYYIEKGDYLKLRSLRLSYDLPRSWARGGEISVFTEAQNVWVATKYTGIDPEVPYAGDTNVPGVDRGAYPLPRIFMGGINVKF
jgi:TonB-dependent starch-binding outer membrane protein SusC